MFKKILIATILLGSIQAQAVKEMTEFDALALIKAEKLPVIMEVFATWCEPCKMTAPLFAQAEKDFKGKAVFIKVDLDKSPELQKVIKAIPFMAVFKKGKAVRAISGAPTKQKDLNKFITDALKK